MKKLLSFFTMLILTAAYLTGCQQDPNSGINSQPMAAGVKANAHPAWTFGSADWTISVSDSDGTDLAQIYISSQFSYAHEERFPTWSPNGASISFVEAPTPTSNWYVGLPWGPCSVKAVEVTVGNNGVAKGSNARTICSYTLADSVKIIVQAWCPVASVNKIAFLAITPTEVGVYTVSASGGTPTKIYSVNQSTAILNMGALMCGSLAWSNDGTKIAFIERSPLATADADLIYKIRIIDVSGTLLTTLDEGSHIIGGLKWSHSGMDSISFHQTNVLHAPGGADGDVYVIGTTAGSTPRLVKSAAACSFWSPNNSELLYLNYSSTSPAIEKINVGTGTVTSLSSIAYGRIGNYGDWKQP